MKNHPYIQNTFIKRFYNIKRTLQLENVSSLKAIVQRAMAVKMIQENSFSEEKGRSLGTLAEMGW